MAQWDAEEHNPCAERLSRFDIPLHSKSKGTLLWLCVNTLDVSIPRSSNLAYQIKVYIFHALLSLVHALSLAEPEGYVRIFVDEGLPMANLLNEALSRGIAPDYVRILLATFAITELHRATSSISLMSEFEYIEPLSKREREVLQLIAEGLSNKEIASRLYLSMHTGKVHARQIFAKLGVKSRTQAVAMGKALGILSPN